MLKIKQISATLAFTALSAIGVSGAYASPPNGTAADYGSLVAGNYHDRQISISPQTTYVNVNDGETVRFVIGDKSFNWNFDTYHGGTAVDLARIAPAGISVQSVRVYIAQNPTYAN